MWYFLALKDLLHFFEIRLRRTIMLDCIEWVFSFIIFVV